jgi:hypothetical protein
MKCPSAALAVAGALLASVTAPAGAAVSTSRWTPLVLDHFPRRASRNRWHGSPSGSIHGVFQLHYLNAAQLHCVGNFSRDAGIERRTRNLKKGINMEGPRNESR